MQEKSWKVTAGKSKVMVLNGEGGLECEIRVDGMRLEHVSEFKYLLRVLNDSSTGEAEFRRKVASGRKVTGAFRYLANVRRLQLECARVLYEILFLPVLMYGNETMI